MNEQTPTIPEAAAPRSPEPSARASTAGKKRSRTAWILPACGGLVVGLLAAGIPLASLWSDADVRSATLADEVAVLEGAVAEAQADEAEAHSESNTFRTDLKAYEQREEKFETRTAELDEREAGLDDREAEISSEEERVAQNSFGSGTYVVGTDIEPGTYRTDGGGSLCYWARLSGGGGGFGDIIANDNVDGPTTVVISPTDWGFENSRCGTWTKVG